MYSVNRIKRLLASKTELDLSHLFSTEWEKIYLLEMQLNILEGKNNKENLYAFIRKAVSDLEIEGDYRR